MKALLAALMEYRRVRNELRHVAKRDGVPVSDIQINRLARVIQCEEELSTRGRVFAIITIGTRVEHGYGGQPYVGVTAIVLHDDRRSYHYEVKEFIREEAACA